MGIWRGVKKLFSIPLVWRMQKLTSTSNFPIGRMSGVEKKKFEWKKNKPKSLNFSKARVQYLFYPGINTDSCLLVLGLGILLDEACICFSLSSTFFFLPLFFPFFFPFLSHSS